MLNKHRLVVSIIAILFMLFPLLAGCSSTPPPPTTAAQQGTQNTPATASGAGTTPTVGQSSTNPNVKAPSGPEVKVTLPFPVLDTFDTAYWKAQLLISQGTIFEGLFGYEGQDLKVVPKIATSYQASPDNKVWTFKIRTDKKWADGTPVTADDFYNAWMRFMSPALKDAPMWAGFEGQVLNGYAYKAGAAKPEDVGVKKIDEQTLQVTLTQPNPVLENLMVLASAMPIESKVLKEHPNDWWDPKYGAYNGPYVVKQWTNGGETTLVKNPNYVGDGIGNITTFVLRPYGDDPNATMQAFENGDIQFTFISDPSQVQYVQRNPKLKDLYHEVLPLAWWGIQYDRSVNYGPLSDIRVRKALAMAIDKKAITDNVMKGVALPINGFLYDPHFNNIKPLPYDINQAKQLLAEAGYPDGKGFPTLTFYAPPATNAEVPRIEAIAKMWQDNLGIKVNIQNNETAVYSSLQWANYNQKISPGYSTLGGPMNWWEPIYLLANSNHIWYFMDYKPDWLAKEVEWDNKINDVANLKTAGNWDQLQQQANDAWANRQKIAAQENNLWGKTMLATPTFKEQFDEIATHYKNAKDDAAKLSAYQDGLKLVLSEQEDQDRYAHMTDETKVAYRQMAQLSQSTMDQAYQYAVPLQQEAVDSAYMVPIAVQKMMYIADPKLTGIILNRFSWGNIFQLQYWSYGK